MPREEKDSSLKIGKNSANNWLPARLGISKAKIKNSEIVAFKKIVLFWNLTHLFWIMHQLYLVRYPKEIAHCGTDEFGLTHF